MAKVKTSSIASFMAKPKRKRKGVHAKTKISKSKTAKNYVNLSRGQG
jgi:ribosomal protein L23